MTLQYKIRGGSGSGGGTGPGAPPTDVATFASESTGIAGTAAGQLFRVSNDPNGETPYAAPHASAPLERVYYHAAGGVPVLLSRSPQRTLNAVISSGSSEPSSFIDISASQNDYSAEVDLTASSDVYRFMEITGWFELTLTSSPAAPIDYRYEMSYEDASSAFIIFTAGEVNIPIGAPVGTVYREHFSGVLPVTPDFIQANGSGSNTAGNVDFEHEIRISRIIDAPSFANEPS